MRLNNFICILRNGQKNRIMVVKYSFSKAAVAVLNVLQQNGYIRGYRISKKNMILEILLKYKNQEPAFQEILWEKRSVYVSAKHKSKVRGTIILSTNKGIISHHTAHRLNVGGLFMLRIW